MLKQSQNLNEPGSFDRAVDIEHARVVGRLIGDDTDASTIVAAKPDDDVGCEIFLFDLEEITDYRPSARMISFMSYASLGLVGIIELSSSERRSTGSEQGCMGGSSMLF
jgi:hypothetical protein